MLVSLSDLGKDEVCEDARVCIQRAGDETMTREGDAIVSYGDTSQLVSFSQGASPRAFGRIIPRHGN